MAQNTGGIAIGSLSVSVSGVSVPLTLNSTLPLLPEGTVSGASAISLQALPLVLGAVYPVAVTATFSDGVSVTNSTSITYSLA